MEEKEKKMKRKKEKKVSEDKKRKRKVEEVHSEIEEENRNNCNEVSKKEDMEDSALIVKKRKKAKKKNEGKMDEKDDAVQNESSQYELHETTHVAESEGAVAEQSPVTNQEQRMEATLDIATKQDERDIQHHDKQLQNKLLTRKERQRRDNQRKMQEFVAELRAQGKTKKEIDKLKKKVQAKLKYIQPNQAYNTVVGLVDMPLTCRECQTPFTFSVQEQRFYQEREYQPPVRCRDCTAAKKVRMASFNEKKEGWVGRSGMGNKYNQDHRNSYGSNVMQGGGIRSNWGNI